MSRQPKILIVAMTRDLLIGAAGRIPWHIPEELKLFRRLTSGHTLIMGRHTFVSIGRALPDRRTIVVSRTLQAAPGCEVCSNLSDALALAEWYGRKIFFAGGVEIYRRALPLVDQLSISWIRGEYSGDTYFPEYDPQQWQQVEEQDYASFRHVLYCRKKD